MAKIRINQSVTSKIDFQPLDDAKARFWAWFREHKDQVLVNVKILWIPVVKITVGDLEDLWRKIF